jgi:tetratricopeptide (TPR) repeat protein
LRRWCARNPTVAGLSAALLLALVAGLIGMTWLWRHADEQRDAAEIARDAAKELAVKAQQQQGIAEEQKRFANEQKVVAEKQARLAKAQAEYARREAIKATRTAQLMVNMFEAADPLGINGIPVLKARTAESLTVREILDRGALQVVKDLADEPDTQAKLLDTLGNVYCTLGLVKKGQPLLEKALALRRRFLTANHPDLAATAHDLAFAYHQTGDYTKANDLYREALGIRQQHAAAEPLPLSATCFNLGWLLADLEDYAGAEEMFQKAIELRVRALGANHRDVAVARVGLAASFIAQGKITNAVAPYLEAMTTLRKIEGGKGVVESIDLFQKGVLGRDLPELLRSTLLGLKDKKAVEQCFQDSLALARKHLGNKHPYVALIHHELAATLRNHGKLAEAEQSFRDCLAVLRDYGLDHPKATIVLANFCGLLQQRQKQGEAEKLLDEALQVRRQHFAGRHSSVADILTLQASLLPDSGLSGRRSKLLREALEHYFESPGTPPGLVGDCVSLLTEDFEAEEVFELACQVAQAAANRSIARNRERYRDLAIRTLHHARSKGFHDCGRLKEDERLAGLREHKDFPKVVARFQARDDDATVHIVGTSGLFLQDALTPDDPPDVRGNRRYHKVFLVHLEKGKAYTIDLTAKAFDAFLRVENAIGRHLAEDDDGGSGTDARLLFRPITDGTYRLIVTTFDGRHGAFTLRVKVK